MKAEKTSRRPRLFRAGAGACIVLALLVLALFLFTGRTGPEAAAREFLAAVDRGDFARAVALETYPLRAETPDEQESRWRSWRTDLENFARATGTGFVPVSAAPLEQTSRGDRKAEFAVYWNDAVVRLALNRAEKGWQVAEVELKPAPALKQKLLLAVMSRHTAIPEWLSGLDKYWNSGGRWDIDAAGWTDFSWQDDYMKVRSDLAGHFLHPLNAVLNSGDPEAVDPELRARVRKFEEMVEQVGEEVRQGMNGANPNLPWTRGHVPRAKEIYRAWEKEHAAGLPSYTPEQVNAVLEAGFRLLKASGAWPGWIDADACLARARWD